MHKKHKKNYFCGTSFLFFRNGVLIKQKFIMIDPLFSYENNNKKKIINLKDKISFESTDKKHQRFIHTSR